MKKTAKTLHEKTQNLTQNSPAIFLGFFLLITIFRQPLTTLLVRGPHPLATPTQLALAREFTRILFFWSTLARNFRALPSYRSQRKIPRLFFGGLLLRGCLASRFAGQPLRSRAIGAKYSLQRIRIFLSATRIFRSCKNVKFSFFTEKSIATRGIFILSFSRLRQISKFFLPEFFTRRGFGPVGDRKFDAAPPLFYRTGPGGDPRLSGIFAGPNNFGYLLTALGPALRLATKTFSTKFSQIFSKILRGISLLATRSRAAILGSVAAFSRLFSRNSKITRKSPKIRTIFVAVLALLTTLTISKRSSTTAHLATRLDALDALTRLGHGRGSAGPAVHHGGLFLPENFFLQITLDLGLPGLIIFLGLLRALRSTTQKITQKLSDKKSQKISNALRAGFLGLVTLGLFLHVFEDSTVNFLFFSIRAFFLTQSTKKTNHQKK